MGLAICVGTLADMLRDDPEFVEDFEDSLAIANRLLVAAGKPAHVEPRTLEQPVSRAMIDSFPYSFIHYLRRAVALQRMDSAWVAQPLAEGEEPDDPALDAEYVALSSHVICHSDAEGFYFPVDFDEPIVDTEETGLSGGILGSSYRVLDELVAVAPALGIRLEDGQLSDAEADRINALVETENPLMRELCSWIAFYEAARLSLAHRTAIFFS